MEGMNQGPKPTKPLSKEGFLGVPEGWKTNRALTDELGIDFGTLKRRADKYRETNRKYFQEYKTLQGHIYEHYSPELVQILSTEIENYKKNEEAPLGWKTNGALATDLNIHTKTLAKLADKYRETNKESFKEYKIPKGPMYEHYSPELISILRDEVNKSVAVPVGWMTNKTLARQLNVGPYILKSIVDKYRQTNREYFGEFKTTGTKSGSVREHYSPEFVNIIKQEVDKLKETPEAPPGWKTNEALSGELNVAQGTTVNIANKYRESNPKYFSRYRAVNKGLFFYEYYSPLLVEIISNEIKNFKETPEAPPGWKTTRALSAELKIHPKTVVEFANKYREANPAYFANFKSKTNNIREYYSPELVHIITEKIMAISDAPEGWLTNGALAKQLGSATKTISDIANDYKVTHPNWFEIFKVRGVRPGSNREHYSPELIEVITNKINIAPKAPDGWKTNKVLLNELATGAKTIYSIVNRYRLSNPDYFGQFKGKGGVYEYYSPELISIIQKEIIDYREERQINNQEQTLEVNFENFVQEIIDEKNLNETTQKIREIIRLLPGNAHDIILKYHPQYKGLRPEYIKEMIAEYLGDFMLSKNEWQPTDVIKIREVMDIEGIREEILINLKNASLTFVNSERKLNPDANEEMLIEVYFQKPEMTLLASSGIQEVASALEELREYYAHIFRLREKKPGNITDSLREGRIFPDINQLVNIQEMSEKKKMLIADEMGLGKSASAILTKEYFGLRCGLVIVPSNVVDTWKNYLSDSINERGKQVGYFKKGLAPKVLIIESPKDLEKLQTEVFDYILVSQEKISGEGYGTVLGQVDFDMMIVDEVHKLKNIETGVRSKAVDALAVKIEGQDKYLALLSGTPVPNKVKDIAITLKLLYPEKYKEFSSKEMVRRILYGDLIDLRSELLKRMQMKELAASIEMPKLTESDISVELAPEEREIYEILLEEDELTALDKILLFRQFLLNPEILKVEPGFVGSKIKQLDETLNEDLKTQQKIIVFVNGYVEGVIKGEHNIIQKMHLPEGTMVEEIHGDISKEERKRIEEELKFGNQKTVVFVSGQTADVGVDFSGADGLIFYNDPWSKYEKNQQRGRVYREGLKNPLSSKTLVTKNSIEQGIRQYINAKEKAIEKLLRGISNTEAEKKLLYNDSKLVHADVETNAQLSKEYLSDWEKLMIHFGEGFESGEKRFREELSKTGKEYANLYRKLGRLTYQGNNARVTTTLIEKMVDERKEAIDSLHIVDIASGPEMLKEAASEKIKGKIFSMDINAEHFAQSAEPEKTISASYLNLPLPDSSVDYTNLGFAFHQTSPIKYFKKNYERLQVLAEMNRVLKPGGRAIISMLHNIEFTNRETFQKLIERLGFQFVPEYTGDAASKENYKSGIFTLEKVSDIPEYKSDALKFDSADNARYIAELGDKLGRELLEGLEIKKTTKGRSNIRDQRRMIEKVTIGDREIELVFNSKDRELLTEELQSIKDGEDLKKKYGGIQNIPIEEIKKIGFERKLETPGYYLLYKIIKDGGAVIIRGDYRSKARKESIPV